MKWEGPWRWNWLLLSCSAFELGRSIVAQIFNFIRVLAELLGFAKAIFFGFFHIYDIVLEYSMGEIF